MKKYFPILYILLSTIILFLIIKSFRSIEDEYNTKNPITRLTDGPRNFREGYFSIEQAAGTIGSMTECQGLGLTGDEQNRNGIRQIIGSCRVTPGCTNPTALNYDPTATEDDPNNPCISKVYGCMDDTYMEYDSAAVPPANVEEISATNSGTPCITEIVVGCMDNTAFNYVPTANTPDLTNPCIPVVSWSTPSTPSQSTCPPWTPNTSSFTMDTNTNYGVCSSETETVDDQDCVAQGRGAQPTSSTAGEVCTPGCTDSTKLNYVSGADIVSNSSMCGATIVPGCMDSDYTEYTSAANQDNGTCSTVKVVGCMDAGYCASTGCMLEGEWNINYNAGANTSTTCTPVFVKARLFRMGGSTNINTYELQVYSNALIDKFKLFLDYHYNTNDAGTWVPRVRYSGQCGSVGNQYFDDYTLTNRQECSGAGGMGSNSPSGINSQELRVFADTTGGDEAPYQIHAQRSAASELARATPLNAWFGMAILRLPSWQDTDAGSNDWDQGWGTVTTTGFRKFRLEVKANMGDSTGYQWVTATHEGGAAYSVGTGYEFANL